jgi:hypothetical protein
MFHAFISRRTRFINSRNSLWQTQRNAHRPVTCSTGSAGTLPFARPSSEGGTSQSPLAWAGRRGFPSCGHCPRRDVAVSPRAAIVQRRDVAESPPGPLSRLPCGGLFAFFVAERCGIGLTLAWKCWMRKQHWRSFSMPNRPVMTAQHQFNAYNSINSIKYPLTQYEAHDFSPYESRIVCPFEDWVTC